MKAMNTHTLQCCLPLPRGFRVADVLAFQGRDSQQLSECTLQTVQETGFDKALVWIGRLSCLEVRFDAVRVRARCRVDDAGSGAPVGVDEQAVFERLLRHMLGLDQPVEVFERIYASHPQMGPLISRNAGLRVPQAASPFEALSWAILGQQISLGAAVAIRRKLIQAVGRRHSGGLMCYPDAFSLLQLDVAALRAAGCSQAKADTLLTLSRAVADGSLPLDHWLDSKAVDDIRPRLLAIRGIGPWTVNYALLRGFGWLDGSLHGDAAVRRNLQHLLGLPARIGETEAQRWLETFSPWRALAAAHLWALQAGD